MKNKEPRFRYISVRLAVLIGALAALLLVADGALFFCSYAYGFSIYYPLTITLLCIGIIFAGAKWILHPYFISRKMLRLFIGGYTANGIYEMPVPYDRDTDQLLQKVSAILSATDSENRDAQYRALQNQINPHFLYNTLEGIRGEALAAGLTSVAEMTEALATFFRYTISNVDNFVTVADELSNIENYFIIQQFRFGNRFALKIDYDESDWPIIRECRCPKLTLQPIVENSILHGLEQKTGNGLLKISFSLTRSRLVIVISDNGAGMDEGALSALNERLNHPADVTVVPGSKRRGGIGMVNVNNRIRLLFGEEYGLSVRSIRGAGTEVEITLPIITRDDGLSAKRRLDT